MIALRAAAELWGCMGAARVSPARPLAAALFVASVAGPSSAFAWVRTTTCDAVCTWSCPTQGDGVCDDTTGCAFGSDCDDCGYRAATALCDNTCASANDGVCNDTSACDLGTDCADCGVRPPGATCDDTCPDARNGVCDDGDAGSCEPGSDCADCGVRTLTDSARTLVPCAPDETPIPLWWAERSVSWRLNEAGYSALDDAETIAVLSRSFDTWSDQTCSSLRLVYAGRTAETQAGLPPDREAVNFVHFVEDGWVELRYPRAALALTSVTYNPRTGQIADADIEMNATLFEFSIIDGPSLATRHDIENTVTHEVGHFVGLEHTTEAAHTGSGTYTDATMAASSPGGETGKRSLHEDDVAALCDAYPLDRVVPTEEPRRSRCATASGGTTVLWVLLALGGLFRRRSRR